MPAATKASRQLLNLERAFYNRAGGNGRKYSLKKEFWIIFFPEPILCVNTFAFRIYFSSWRKLILNGAW